MALYAIGDLHLSLGSDKPMDVFGGGWTDYIEKIKIGFDTLLPDDICVLCGDISWGMSLEESLEDFRFIENLPGKKLVIKGNHDYWWNTASKMKSFFNDNDISSIEILHNNCFFYEDAAICGTRGWLLESDSDIEHNAKITARETSRLRASLTAAGETQRKLCFFHYPPVYKDLICREIVQTMKEFDVKECWYGHIHGAGQRSAENGMTAGIKFKMISADYVDFKPQRVL